MGACGKWAGRVLAAEASLLSVVQSAERSLEARMGRLAAESAGLGLGEREEALSWGPSISRFVQIVFPDFPDFLGRLHPRQT